MRNYSQVAPQFWTGETGKKLKRLGRNAQVVALYLITCPSANMIGLYYLPLPVLCHEVGLSREGALEALRRVSEGGFAHYDDSLEVVWVVNMAKFQIAQKLNPKDKRIKGITRELEVFRKSKFFNSFLEKYKETFNLHDIRPSEAPSKPLQRALEAPPKGLLNQEQEKELLRPPSSRNFEDFWRFYPKRNGKKIGKKEALEYFTAHIKTEEMAQLVQAAINYSKSKLAMDGYSKDPIRFLKKDYWREWMEPETIMEPTGMEALKQLHEDEAGEDGNGNV